jgi:type I restriction enzyme, S subunit
MSAMWPRVRLGEVLRRSAETVTISPEAEYREITVKLWGKGVVLRRAVSGTEIASDRRFLAKASQFILSRIDARNGAIGVAPPELDGAVVTNDFPLFDLNVARIDPAFLGWLSKTHDFVELCQRASEGTTNRVRLQEERFLALEIPLPPLSEQRRIVARIEELAAQIHEARALRQQAVEEVEALCRSILSHDTDTKPTSMRELVRLRSPDVVVSPDESYQFAGVYSFGRGVFRAYKKSGMDFAYLWLTRVQAGNFVYPKLMAWEGALGIVPPECNGCVVSTEFPVFEVLEDRVFPEILYQVALNRVLSYKGMHTIWRGLVWRGYVQ